MSTNKRDASNSDCLSTDDMVLVRGAYKQYGIESRLLKILTPKDKPHIALAGLNMTVKRGTIYTLLGPSGCGKTTLLSCIIGRKTMDAGKILLGIKYIHEMGYMPQEEGLQDGLSIEENITFYGRLFRLNQEYFRRRKEALYKFLELPAEDRVVSELSGGQRRRVSLCIALLHNPDLLILDEPTVGLDPTVSHRIWEYFVALSDNEKKTLIITTHYIHEASKAHKIGMMRNGVILEEGNPQELMAQYGSESLDELFLKLSYKQSPIVENSQIYLKDSSEVKSSLLRNESFSFNNCRAQLINCANFIRRNIPALITLLLIPLVQCACFNFSIGRHPDYVYVGVISYELALGRETCTNWTLSCNSEEIYGPLSCQYINSLEENRMRVVIYDNAEKAKEDVLNNYIWGYMHIDQNYSRSLLKRLEFNMDTKDSDLDKSEIAVYLDMSNQFIGNILKSAMYSAYEAFLERLYVNCSWPLSAAKIPIHFYQPIYGTQHIAFKAFSLPTVLELSSFFLPVIYLVGGVVGEKRQGLWVRFFVSGMSLAEVISGHIALTLLILVVQVVSMIVLVFMIFDNVLVGSTLLYTMLLYCVGVCGMSFGVFIGVLCDTEFTASFMSLGSFFPFAVICGMLWPFEGMHYLLRYFSKFLPLSMTTEALRAVALRGWGISSEPVILGLLSLLVWIVIYFSLAYVTIKIRKLS